MLYKNTTSESRGFSGRRVRLVFLPTKGWAKRDSSNRRGVFSRECHTICDIQIPAISWITSSLRHSLARAPKPHALPHIERRHTDSSLPWEEYARRACKAKAVHLTGDGFKEEMRTRAAEMVDALEPWGELLIGRILPRHRRLWCRAWSPTSPGSVTKIAKSAWKRISGATNERSFTLRSLPLTTPLLALRYRGRLYALGKPMLLCCISPIYAPHRLTYRCLPASEPKTEKRQTHSGRPGALCISSHLRCQQHDHPGSFASLASPFLIV